LSVCERVIYASGRDSAAPAALAAAAATALYKTIADDDCILAQVH